MFWSCVVPCARPVEAIAQKQHATQTINRLHNCLRNDRSSLPWSGWLQVSYILWFIMQSWCHFPNFSSPLDFQIASKHHQGSSPTICTIRQRWGFCSATVGPGCRRPRTENHEFERNWLEAKHKAQAEAILVRWWGCPCTNRKWGSTGRKESGCESGSDRDWKLSTDHA